MQHPPDGSVTQWIAALKEGDQQAARQLWERYFQKLVTLARHRLASRHCRHQDEEDVALSVFYDLCRGAAAGRFEELTNRNDLWWLLLSIARNTAHRHLRDERRLKRGGGRVWGESDLRPAEGASFHLDQLMSEEPTPEILVILSEEQQRLFALLRDDQMRQIALWTMEGLKPKEIAERLGISVRSVLRKLALIRTKWARELVR